MKSTLPPHSPVVVAQVSFSPPIVKSRSREARPLSVHARSHEGHHSSNVHDPHLKLLFLPFHRFRSAPTYLRRLARYSHRSSHNTHTENPSTDSQTISPFYNNLGKCGHRSLNRNCYLAAGDAGGRSNRKYQRGTGVRARKGEYLLASCLRTF